MITKEDENEFTVNCDKCSNCDTYEAEIWVDLLQQMKEDGWKTVRVDGEWEHYCEDCKNNIN